MDQANAVAAHILLTEMSEVNTQIEAATTSLAKECKQAVHLADEIGTPVYAQFATGVTMISGEEKLYVEFQALRLLNLLTKYRTLRDAYDKIKLVVNLDLCAVGENMANEIEVSVPNDYKMSEGEKNNLVYLVCKYTVGWGMRSCDFVACCLMAAQGPQTGVEAIKNLTRVSCEYVWDHISGKPDNFTPEMLYAHMAEYMNEWYSDSTPEERADIN